MIAILSRVLLLLSSGIIFMISFHSLLIAVDVRPFNNTLLFSLFAQTAEHEDIVADKKSSREYSGVCFFWFVGFEESVTHHNFSNVEIYLLCTEVRSVHR